MSAATAVEFRTVRGTFEARVEYRPDDPTYGLDVASLADLSDGPRMSGRVTSVEYADRVGEHTS